MKEQLCPKKWSATDWTLWTRTMVMNNKGMIIAVFCFFFHFSARNKEKKKTCQIKKSSFILLCMFERLLNVIFDLASYQTFFFCIFFSIRLNLSLLHWPMTLSLTLPLILLLSFSCHLTLACSFVHAPKSNKLQSIDAFCVNAIIWFLYRENHNTTHTHSQILACLPF